MTKTNTTPSTPTRDERNDQMAVTGAAVLEAKSKASPSNATDDSPSAKRADDDGLRLAALRDVPQQSKPTFTDVRGWQVHTKGGKPIGLVRRILVDQSSGMTPRYLDIQMDASAIGTTEDATPNVLIPIGRAQVSPDVKVVLMPEVSLEMLRALPRRPQGAIEWQYEVALSKAFGLKTELSDRNALYADDLFSLRYFEQLQPK